MKDIPLRIAMVYWHKSEDGCTFVRIVEWPNHYNVFSDAYSDGACCGHWERMTTAARLHYLFTLFVELTVREQIDPKVVADAFNVIPEFRAIFDDLEQLQLPIAVRRCRAAR